MSDCKCNENHDSVNSQIVPDFTKVGFAPAVAQTHKATADLQSQGVLALKLSACVSASYNQQTNKICFTAPIYGDFCVTSPVTIPAGAEIKACVETCGSFFPSGLKVTIYLNGSVIYSTVLWGSC